MRPNLASFAFALFIIGWGGGVAAQEGQTLFGSWMYKCDEGPCQVYLSLADPESNTAQLTWSFVYDSSEGALSSIINVPLGVALQPGLLVTADEEERPVPFQVCDETGCRAVLRVPEALLASLTTADEVRVQFIPYGRSYRASFSIPTDGLDEATAHLRASTLTQ